MNSTILYKYYFPIFQFRKWFLKIIIASLKQLLHFVYDLSFSTFKNKK